MFSKRQQHKMLSFEDWVQHTFGASLDAPTRSRDPGAEPPLEEDGTVLRVEED